LRRRGHEASAVIATPARHGPPWLSIAGFLVGMAGIGASITVVFPGMRSVLDVGGQAESHQGTVVSIRPAWLLGLAVLAIILGIAAGAWFYPAAAGS
jgi:hypothetical protein